jgi:hypothetical protein
MTKIMATEIHETLYFYEGDSQDAELSIRVHDDNSVMIQQESEDEIVAYWIQIPKRDWNEIVKFVQQHQK